MAQGKLDSAPAAAAELIDAALEDLRRATAELRELARGIHPAALTEGGLRPALLRSWSAQPFAGTWWPFRLRDSLRRSRPRRTSSSRRP